MREDPVEGNTVNSSSRRHFLKSGALIAAPLAAMAVPAAAMAAPAAAQADDGTAQALARLKDERALHDMQRALLRETEGAARSRIAGMIEGAGEDVAAIRPDLGSDSTLEFSDDGNSAVATHICKVERNQAKADLLAFAQNMESMYSTNNFSYLHDSAQAGNIFPPYSPSNRTPGQKRFDLSVTVSEPGDAFILTAERVGGSCNDGRLTLANNGQRQWVKAGVTLDYWED